VKTVALNKTDENKIDETIAKMLCTTASGRTDPPFPLEVTCMVFCEGIVVHSKRTRGIRR
jgi:hypothetical protein